ncbi:3-hydroxyacyl-ACP dehydratase FabZ, partial [bacterium]
GDLYLFGQPIIGNIIALKSGHALNIKLLRKLGQQRAECSLDVNDIMKILPHREPFLFVDRIISLEPGKRITGIKNVTINDYFFRGHFPGKPVMPGVIIIEAMAQVGGVMMLSLEENKGKIAYFMSINNAKFRKTVVPGDQLVFKVEAVKVKSKTGQVRGEAYVGDKIVAEADLMFVMSD